MKTTIELNEKDIIDILAKYFKIPSNYVRVEVRKDTEGYGITEHFVNNVYAVISKMDLE